MLTAAQQGTLVVATMDKLPWLGDYLNDDMGTEDGCCPDCCAPCGVVREIDQAGLLDTVVTWAPNHLWGDGTMWWRNGSVDRTWLYAIWDCQSRPHCKSEEVVDTYSLDHIAERFARQRRLTVPEAYRLLEERLRYEEETLARDDRPKPIPVPL